jgi:hypothetical protein
MTNRVPGSRNHMIWLLPPSGSTLRLRRRLRKRDNLLTGGGGVMEEPRHRTVRKPPGPL